MNSLQETRKEFENIVNKFLKQFDENFKLFTEKEREIDILKKKITEMESTLAIISQERDQLNIELMTIEDQFRRLSSLYEETTKKKMDIKNVKDLLSIYITLLEDVFGAKPHARILFLIHGDKEVWTREELNKSTGFEPIAILRALHELTAAKLIDYDENSNEVRIIKRIY